MNLFTASILLVLSLNAVFSGCNKDPGVPKDAPMTAAEQKENEEVGKIP